MRVGMQGLLKGQWPGRGAGQDRPGPRTAFRKQHSPAEWGRGGGKVGWAGGRGEGAARGSDHAQKPSPGCGPRPCLRVNSP